MNKVYITAAKRTAIGKFQGSLTNLTPAEMASIVMRDILKTTGINPGALDEVIVGNILMAGQKQGIARQAAIAAGIPAEVPAWGINMICGSGMKSIMTAYNNIRCGEANMIIAGGTENMSNAGFVMPGTIRQGIKLGNFQALDHMVHDGLTDAFSGLHMGITAENIAEKYGISRQEQDDFAWNSLSKAISAIDSGRFKDEIVRVEIVQKKSVTIFDTDEHPNRTSTLEKLASLSAAFKKEGTVTAGNASGINDGAAFLLLASEEAIQQHGLTPLAEIVAIGQGGVDPQIMGMGPVPAIAQALKKANLHLKDMAVMELNEAFAAQSLGVMHQLSQDHGMTHADLAGRINPNGGAIALGHPIGASGARITVSLLHEMLRSRHHLGLASLCIGGGMGTALILRLAGE